MGIKHLRALLAFVGIVMTANAALAQTPTVIQTYTGSTVALGNGIAFNSGQKVPLFALTSSSLQFTNQFTLSYGIQASSFGSTANVNLLNNFSSTPSNTGISARYNTSFSNSSNFEMLILPGVAGTCGGSETCLRNIYLQDGNFHNVCTTWNGSNQLSTYIDGHLWDQTNAAVGFATNTHFWQLGDFNQPFTMRSVRLYNANLGAAGCTTLGGLALQGVEPSSGWLQNNLILWLNNAGISGSGWSDASGNGNNFFYDTTAPTVVVTNPANGATGLAGNVSLQATCTDTVTCTSVAWYVDGVLVGSATTSPYTTTWATANYIDGSHTITAQGTNAGGIIGSASITASTSNSVTIKSVFLDPTSANDCPFNSGTSSSTPCSTLAGVQSVINASTTHLHGGDSVLLKAGTTLNLANMTSATELSFCGASSSSWGACTAQNTFPGQQITVGTYGGSGNCTVLSAVTTDCATIIVSTTASVLFWSGVMNAVNVPNITFQNIRFVGTGGTGAGGSTGATACIFNVSGCGQAISIKTAGSYVNQSISGTGTLITNIETTDFFNPIVVSFGFSGTGGSGTLCGGTVQNSYVHGAALGSHINSGITYYGGACPNGTSTGVTATSNYTTNTDGTLNNHDGSGIVFLNGNNNVVDTFNVTTAASYNPNDCGQGYGNWWFQTHSLNGQNNVVKGNESANNFPSSAGCDSGAFDLDNGTSGFMLTFNYAHETYGPAVNVLLTAVGSFLAGNNVQAYNIYENFSSQTTNQNGAATAIGARTGESSIYNNNFWNGYNGTIVPPLSATTEIAGLGYGGCPVTASVMANNIVVSNKGNAPNAEMYYGFVTGIGSCATLNVLSNDFYQRAGTGTPLWRSVVSTGDAITTISAWNTDINSGTDQNINPNLAGTGGGALACYTPLSGVPVQPGTIPCPSAYELNNNTNVLIGAGTNLASAPYNKTLPATDYFNVSIPNGVGTGYNIGADGAHH